MRHWTHVAVAICALSAAADEGMTTWGSLEVFHPVQGFDAPVRSISAGRSHNTVLLEDGSLVGWGRNNFSQAKVEEMPSSCHQIASGYDHNVALLTDGSIFCWGDPSGGKCEPPVGDNFIQVAAGQEHSIALRDDGTIACWGAQIYCDAPPDGDFVSIHAGGDFSIGLKSNGMAVGWGPGVGTEVPENASWMQIDAGSNHGIGLLPTGEARCWGGNSDGQLDVPEGQRFVQVAAGHNHSMGLKVDGSVICWGGSDVSVCDAPDEQFALIAGGDQHSLGLTRSGELHAWGDRNYGNIYGQSSVPVGAPVKSMATRGNNVVAVVQADGRLFVFGISSESTLMDIPDRSFREVTVGGGFLVGITEERDLACWGNFPSPPELNDVVSVSSGSGHVIAVLSDGTIAQWPDAANLTLPSEIYTQVSAGDLDNAGVGVNNAIYVNGGWNFERPNQNDFIYSKVAFGRRHLLALTLDGRVEAYGDNNFELISNPPRGNGFIEVHAGRYHAAAVHDDGSINYWGREESFSSASTQLSGEQSLYLGEDITAILDVSDCDQNGISDIEEIIAGNGVDLNTNWVLDVCDPDCDQDGVPDFAAIENGAFDCNVNQIPDSCEAGDDNQNGFLDACEVDCNLNGVIDFLDLIGGQAQDQNSNGVPDECDPDCDQDGLPDDVDDQPDCDGDGVPDACDTEGDCDGSGIPDFCEGAFDCNANGIADSCDIATGPSSDVNGDQIPDDCQCVADVNQDDVVNFADLLRILGDFGVCPTKDPCPSDINANGSVDYQDLIRVLSLWGSCG